MGGFTTGGLNFDAKVRRGSYKPDDLFYAHAAGMDAFAKGLKVAYNLLKDGVLEDFIAKRYESYESGIGKDIVDGKVNFKDLETYALKLNKIENPSGRQEYLETLLNEYIYNS
jgi:xylose isomerase